MQIGFDSSAKSSMWHDDKDNAGAVEALGDSLPPAILR